MSRRPPPPRDGDYDDYGCEAMSRRDEREELDGPVPINAMRWAQ